MEKEYRTVNMHTCGLVEVYKHATQLGAVTAAKQANEYDGCPEMGFSRMGGGCEVRAYCFTRGELRRIFGEE